MPLYIFYFCKADGSSPTFEASEHPSRLAARAYGVRLLGEHLSCAYISIWQAEQLVTRVDRRPSDGVLKPRPQEGEGLTST